MKLKIYNYHLKVGKKNIIYNLRLQKDCLILTIYKDDINEVLRFKNYIVNNNEITFEGNVFSTKKIKFNDEVNIEFKINKINIYLHNVCISNFYGIISKEKVEGALYYDVEKTNQMPIDYKKIYYENNEGVFYLFTFKKLVSRTVVKIYLNIHGNIIKENSYISFKSYNNCINIKTYQYIYNLVIDDFNKTNNFNFSPIIVDFTVKKGFKEPLIYSNNTSMIMFSYKI